ncbi:biotin/lipoate A/B protein ligase family protein [Cohnella sp. GCM10027633]|uniref:lipoate--protein ligase family protein n=1 Tax=unclassified Cohnella TaxID=2636738 RepID=UPI0036292ACC
MAATDSYSWAEGMIVLDRTADMDGEALDAFAIDELLGRRVGEGAAPVCHLWRHPRALIMGAKDGRLPGAPEAVRLLMDAGYEAIVRGSGGAAVPLDAGVVNVSLVMPLAGAFAFGFRDDFARMADLIKRAMAGYGLTVRHGEVEGSYCPGDYDLHIDGFKFCGIAQRRQVKAMIVSAFVNVAGSGDARAAQVRAFYDIAGVGAEPRSYPDVVAGRVTSLEERGFAAEDAGAEVDGAVAAGDVNAEASAHGLVSAFVAAIVGTLRRWQTKLGPAEGAASTANAGTLALPDPRDIAEMREKLAVRYMLPHSAR